MTEKANEKAKKTQAVVTRRQSDLQNRNQPEQTRDVRIFTPRTDIYERADAIIVVADMPGVDQNSVEINVEKNVLTITGHTTEQPPQDGYTPRYTEYEIGDFQRTFTLSNEIDVEKIEASISKGVLRITLPKSAAVLPRRIAVKAG